jgi:hypothetical protein
MKKGKEKKVGDKAKRAVWSLASMQRAVRDVMIYKRTERSAALQNEVPRQTLRRHIAKCKEGFGVAKELGRKPVLSEEQEERLVETILGMQDKLFGLSRNDVRKMVFDFCEQNGIKHPFNVQAGIAGKDWFSAFLRRHSNLSLRVPEAVSIQRAMGFNRTKVNQFYDLLENQLFANDGARIIPAQNIYNADETGITICQTPGKIVARKGKKDVGILRSAERGKNITVLMCTNAAGTYVPPLIIFPRVNLKKGKIFIMKCCFCNYSYDAFPWVCWIPFLLVCI